MILSPMSFRPCARSLLLICSSLVTHAGVLIEDGKIIINLQKPYWVEELFFKQKFQQKAENFVYVLTILSTLVRQNQNLYDTFQDLRFHGASKLAVRNVNRQSVVHPNIHVQEDNGEKLVQIVGHNVMIKIPETINCTLNFKVESKTEGLFDSYDILAEQESVLNIYIGPDALYCTYSQVNPANLLAYIQPRSRTSRRFLGELFMASSTNDWKTSHTIAPPTLLAKQYVSNEFNEISFHGQYVFLRSKKSILIVPRRLYEQSSVPLEIQKKYLETASQMASLSPSFSLLDILKACELVEEKRAENMIYHLSKTRENQDLASTCSDIVIIREAVKTLSDAEELLKLLSDVSTITDVGSSSAVILSISKRVIHVHKFFTENFEQYRTKQPLEDCEVFLVNFFFDLYGCSDSEISTPELLEAVEKKDEYTPFEKLELLRIASQYGFIADVDKNFLEKLRIIYRAHDCSKQADSHQDEFNEIYQLISNVCKQICETTKTGQDQNIQQHHTAIKTAINNLPQELKKELSNFLEAAVMDVNALLNEMVSLIKALNEHKGALSDSSEILGLNTAKNALECLDVQKFVLSNRSSSYDELIEAALFCLEIDSKTSPVYKDYEDLKTGVSQNLDGALTFSCAEFSTDLDKLKEFLRSLNNQITKRAQKSPNIGCKNLICSIFYTMERKLHQANFYSLSPNHKEVITCLNRYGQMLKTVVSQALQQEDGKDDELDTLIHETLSKSTLNTSENYPDYVSLFLYLLRYERILIECWPNSLRQTARLTISNVLNIRLFENALAIIITKDSIDGALSFQSLALDRTGKLPQPIQFETSKSSQNASLILTVIIESVLAMVTAYKPTNNLEANLNTLLGANMLKKIAPLVQKGQLFCLAMWPIYCKDLSPDSSEYLENFQTSLRGLTSEAKYYPEITNMYFQSRSVKHEFFKTAFECVTSLIQNILYNNQFQGFYLLKVKADPTLLAKLLISLRKLNVNPTQLNALCKDILTNNSTSNVESSDEEDFVAALSCLQQTTEPITISNGQLRLSFEAISSKFNIHTNQNLGLNIYYLQLVFYELLSLFKQSDLNDDQINDFIQEYCLKVLYPLSHKSAVTYGIEDARKLFNHLSLILHPHLHQEIINLQDIDQWLSAVKSINIPHPLKEKLRKQLYHYPEQKRLQQEELDHFIPNFLTYISFFDGITRSEDLSCSKILRLAESVNNGISTHGNIMDALVENLMHYVSCGNLKLHFPSVPLNKFGLSATPVNAELKTALLLSISANKEQRMSKQKSDVQQELNRLLEELTKLLDKVQVTINQTTMKSDSKEVKKELEQAVAMLEHSPEIAPCAQKVMRLFEQGSYSSDMIDQIVLLKLHVNSLDEDRIKSKVLRSLALIELIMDRKVDSSHESYDDISEADEIRKIAINLSKERLKKARIEQKIFEIRKYLKQDKDPNDCIKLIREIANMFNLAIDTKLIVNQQIIDKESQILDSQSSQILDSQSFTFDPNAIKKVTDRINKCINKCNGLPLDLLDRIRSIAYESIDHREGRASCGSVFRLYDQYGLTSSNISLEFSKMRLKALKQAAGNLSVTTANNQHLSDAKSLLNNQLYALVDQVQTPQELEKLIDKAKDLPTIVDCVNIRLAFNCLQSILHLVEIGFFRDKDVNTRPLAIIDYKLSTNATDSKDAIFENFENLFHAVSTNQSFNCKGALKYPNIKNLANILHSYNEWRVQYSNELKDESDFIVSKYSESISAAQKKLEFLYQQSLLSERLNIIKQIIPNMKKLLNLIPELQNKAIVVFSKDLSVASQKNYGDVLEEIMAANGAIEIGFDYIEYGNNKVSLSKLLEIVQQASYILYQTVMNHEVEYSDIFLFLYQRYEQKFDPSLGYTGRINLNAEDKKAVIDIFSKINRSKDEEFLNKTQDKLLALYAKIYKDTARDKTPSIFCDTNYDISFEDKRPQGAICAFITTVGYNAQGKALRLYQDLIKAIQRYRDLEKPREKRDPRSINSFLKTGRFLKDEDHFYNPNSELPKIRALYEQYTACNDADFAIFISHNSINDTLDWPDYIKQSIDKGDLSNFKDVVIIMLTSLPIVRNPKLIKIIANSQCLENNQKSDDLEQYNLRTFVTLTEEKLGKLRESLLLDHPPSRLVWHLKDDRQALVGIQESNQWYMQILKFFLIKPELIAKDVLMQVQQIYDFYLKKPTLDVAQVDLLEQGINPHLLSALAEQSPSKSIAAMINVIGTRERFRKDNHQSIEKPRYPQKACVTATPVSQSPPECKFSKLKFTQVYDPESKGKHQLIVKYFSNSYVISVHPFCVRILIRVSFDQSFVLQISLGSKVSCFKSKSINMFNITSATIGLIESKGYRLKTNKRPDVYHSYGRYDAQLLMPNGDFAALDELPLSFLELLSNQTFNNNDFYKFLEHGVDEQPSLYNDYETLILFNNLPPEVFDFIKYLMQQIKGHILYLPLTEGKSAEIPMFCASDNLQKALMSCQNLYLHTYKDYGFSPLVVTSDMLKPYSLIAKVEDSTYLECLKAKHCCIQFYYKTYKIVVTVQPKNKGLISVEIINGTSKVKLQLGYQDSIDIDFAILQKIGIQDTILLIEDVLKICGPYLVNGYLHIAPNLAHNVFTYIFDQLNLVFVDRFSSDTKAIIKKGVITITLEDPFMGDFYSVTKCSYRCSAYLNNINIYATRYSWMVLSWVTSDFSQIQHTSNFSMFFFAFKKASSTLHPTGIYVAADEKPIQQLHLIGLNGIFTFELSNSTGAELLQTDFPSFRSNTNLLPALALKKTNLSPYPENLTIFTSHNINKPPSQGNKSCIHLHTIEYCLKSKDWEYCKYLDGRVSFSVPGLQVTEFNGITSLKIAGHLSPSFLLDMQRLLLKTKEMQFLIYCKGHCFYGPINLESIFSILNNQQFIDLISSQQEGNFTIANPGQNISATSKLSLNKNVSLGIQAPISQKLKIIDSAHPAHKEEPIFNDVISYTPLVNFQFQLIIAVAIIILIVCFIVVISSMFTQKSKDYTNSKELEADLKIVERFL